MYWITSNLVTLVQNYLIYNHGPGKKPSTIEAGDHPLNASGTARIGGKSRRAVDGQSDDDASGPHAQRQDESVGNTSQAAKVNKRKRRRKKKR